MIQKMENKPKEGTKEYYDSIPVYYCRNCGSLRIMAVGDTEDSDDVGDYDYCDSCGSTDIGKASIEAWMMLQETIYKNEYYGREGKKPKKAYL